MILALDCATATGSVALVRETGKENFEIVRTLTFPAPRGRGGALFSVLEEILSEADGLTRVVAGTGPGSYNGIRAGLAAAWGIATARGIPLIGLSSLLGLADGSYLTVGDARRGQFYFARVHEGNFLEPPALFSPGEILQKINGGTPPMEGPDPKEEWPIFVPEPIEFLPQAIPQSPQAVRLATRAAFAPRGENLPEPLYLKPAHITRPSGTISQTN